MRAALGYDRQSINEIGDTMLNVILNTTTIGDAGFVETGTACAEYKTPEIDIESGAEWDKYRCANWWVCGSKKSDVVVIDGYDKVSEMHICNRCHKFEWRGERVIRARDGRYIKPFIRIVPDQFNNVRRMCSVMGTGEGRVWKVTNAMRDQDGIRYYYLRHIRTGATRIARSEDMTNLY